MSGPRLFAALAALAALVAAVGLAYVPTPLTPGDPFARHMLRHMLLVAVIAPLLVVVLPTPKRPIPDATVLAATVAEFVVVWGWHLPLLHDLAQVATAVFLLEQASFLAVGYWLWRSALQTGSELAAVGALLLTSMHMTLLGALLVLAAEPLYHAHGEHVATLAGQQIGGVLMLGIGTPVYLVVALARLRRALGPAPGGDAARVRTNPPLALRGER